jgi:hypothetical protein
LNAQENLVNTHDLTTGLPLSPVVCTILLGDVSNVDEHRLPVKETAKFKKGGLHHLGKTWHTSDGEAGFVQL